MGRTRSTTDDQNDHIISIINTSNGGVAATVTEATKDDSFVNEVVVGKGTNRDGTVVGSSVPTGNRVDQDHDIAVAAETAAAAAAVAAARAEAELFPGVDASTLNKWTKNGFGEKVGRQSGKFSKQETELIRASIEEYCAAKQITVGRLCSECDHKSDTKGAWMTIAQKLPHRSVQSIYRHGIRQCHPFKRGAWSEHECNTLSDLVQRMGKKWSAIQVKLNRSADSCRDKHREMSDEYIKGRWRDDETELLQKLIRDHLHGDPRMDMKELSAKAEKENVQIPWSTISKKMGKRSRLSCFKKWQKMTGQVSSSSEYVHKRTRSDDAMSSYDGEDEVKPAPSQRIKSEVNELIADDSAAPDPKAYADAPTAGAAAAIAAGRADYDIYSAKMAAETVEAVELPDTDTLVREI